MTPPRPPGSGEDLIPTQSLPRGIDPEMLTVSVTVEEVASIPDRLGRYTVLQALGSGGFSKVLLAHDDELGREVAIKVPRPDRFPNFELLRTFLEEARTVARLRHPGIVSVFDVGSHEDTPFIVLEYIRGRTLAHLLEHDQLSHSAAARIVIEIADALAHAHEHGFVHRDIKPQNILLDSDDRPHIADFGLAIRHRELIQDDQEVAGTTHYMAPEQVRAENHRIDGRTDLWGLGVVLYRLLVGRRPFDGASSDDVARAILYSDPTPLRQIDPRVPVELERICLRCLSRQMSDRYRTARDLADDLTEWLRRAGDTGGSSSTRRRPLSADPRTVSLVPRGLRSFEPEDAEFFLRLIPGPRDREGLPVLLRFWKQRIERRDADGTFRVGVLYGPSGCGKSSLVKAGLLPRLDDDVTPIYLETTAHDTEERLLKTLQRRFPRLPASTSLPDAVCLLREQPDLRDGRKVLLILDQFEQWLDAWPAGEGADLLRAVRHCDGGQVQCLLLVRDDFWLPVSRFMRLLEISTEEGVNGMLVDSFDLPHARRVLHELGVAYGRLPESSADMSPPQTAFVERATADLAEGQRLYPVRLAVFVEMVKNCEWVPATLDEMGGTEGVGVAFLERSVGFQAPAPRRQHERAARNVLATLLPDAGQIKGSVRPRSELLRAAQYADRPRDFDELMHLLDVELRLLTPGRSADEVSTSVAAGDATVRGPAAEPVYQLTHDFLVPSIRQWLERQMRATRQGRAQLLLQEQAAVWSSRPTPRYLPSVMEWIGLWLGTRRRDWTEPQRRMMHAAALRAARWAAIWAGVLIASSLLCLVAYRGVQRQRDQVQANLLLAELQTVPSAEVPEVVESLAPYGSWVDSRLRGQAADETLVMRRRIRAAVALLPRDAEQVPWLMERLLSEQTSPEDFLVVRQSLKPHAEQVFERLAADLENPLAAAPVRFRAACALAEFEPDSPRWSGLAPEIAGSLLRESAIHASEWIEALRPAGHQLRQPLLAALSQTKTLESARVGALAILTFNQEQTDALVPALVDAEGGRYRAIVELLRRTPEHSQAAVHKQLVELTASEPPAKGTPQARRLANLILALFELGDAAPLREHAAWQADPSVRTCLIHGMNPECMDFQTLWPLIAEPVERPALRNVALLAAWRHREEPVSADLRNRLCNRLAEIYEHDPHSEAHAAAELLLKSLAEDRRAAIATRLSGVNPEPTRSWLVNKSGQTLVVLRPSESPSPGGSTPAELQHTFAISEHEVTLDEFRQHNPTHNNDPTSPDPGGDGPANNLLMAHIAKYCNTLSKLDLIPEDQWCYPTGDKLTFENYDPLPGFLEKEGYRLPTAAEWEFACRGGSTTPRFVGEDFSLLKFYAWDKSQSGMQRQPVGRLLPNPLGLFDVYGNVAELCIVTSGEPPTMDGYVRRGPSCLFLWEAMNSTMQEKLARGPTLNYVGIRVARTLRPQAPAEK